MKFSGSGSYQATYTQNGLAQPTGLAIDAGGNVWLSQYVGISEFTSSGIAASGSEGFGGGTSGTGLTGIASIAIDGSGDVWVANNGNNTVTEFIGLSTPVVTPLVANLISPYTHPASQP